MTIKLMLLKSGEDVISDVSEMCVGTDADRQVIGYNLNRPCVVKMRDPNLMEEEGPKKKSGFCSFSFSVDASYFSGDYSSSCRLANYYGGTCC